MNYCSKKDGNNKRIFMMHLMTINIERICVCISQKGAFPFPFNLS